jgi:hypothetical protein
MTIAADLGRPSHPEAPMLRPETRTDECTDCRTCHGCLVGVHSCCFPVQCVNGPQRHDCNCPVCAPRRQT